MSGCFITLEGVEGSGKSTQASILEERLTERGLSVARFREPGDTTLGDEIRKVVHANRNTIVYPEAEALLYQASRAQLVRQKIIPNLEKGKVVILDRYADSSLVYQGIARGLGSETITWLNNFSTGGLKPDLTFLLDLDPEIGLGRRIESELEMNRLDNEKIEFHKMVREAYLDLRAQEPERYVLINAEPPVNEISVEILTESESRLVSRGLLEGNYRAPERRG